jgi:hypothetical protein
MRFRRLPFLAFVSLLASLIPVASVPPRAAAYQDGSDRRVVAIGDVHGADVPFAAILEKAGLIDDQQRWSGGRSILVQTGDMTDRGAGMRAALDLLMSLEKQASKAGGRVHALLGNHEVMNLVGEMRDAGPEIFATFGGEEAMREAFGPRGTYGRWLRSHSVMVEVGDSIFMHAGVDPAFSDASLNEINRRVRTEIEAWDEGVKFLQRRKLVAASPSFLDAVEAARKELERLVSGPTREEPDVQREVALLFPLANIGTSSLFSPNGPLWFRGFASWNDAEGDAHITALLKKFRAKRFVTGHTVQPKGRITERFAGKLFLIDTGMLNGRFFPSGVPSALEITGDVATPLYLD